MRPKTKSDNSFSKDQTQADTLAEKFPCLALPNEIQKPLITEEKEHKEDIKDPNTANDGDVVADIMAQFELDAPSREVDKSKESKKRERSRSQERSANKKTRDRSRHRSDRDRSRDRERRSERDRSRTRRRDRSRDRHRERSRSRHRNRSNERHRNRSRERRQSRERNRSRERSSVDRHMKKEISELDEDPIPGKVCLLYFFHFIAIC